MQLEASNASHKRPNLVALLILILVPAMLYLSQIGRWGIDRDEVYTLIDSSLPIAKLLEWERKPVYYFICHFLLSLDLNLPTEVILRLPSAIASSLIPVTAYLALRSGGKREKAALLTAVLFLANPWVFGFAVTARFYGMVTLLVLGATAALLRCQESFHHTQVVQHRWLIVFFVVALLATATHTTAVTLFPAGILALLVAAFVDNRLAAIAFVKKWLLAFCLITIALGVIAWWVLGEQIAFWMGSEQGQFGNYSIFELLLALLIDVGIPVWVLALLPLMKPLRSWSSQEWLLSVAVVVGIVPLLVLVQVGGGVAPYYLLAGIPAVFVLAGRHWAFIDDRLTSRGYRLAIGLGILSFNVPYLISTYTNGGHFDYRQAAAYVHSISSDETILVSSGHLNLGLFLPDEREILELGTFDGGMPRELLSELIQKAETEKRPLMVVSRETRHRLSNEDQEWFYHRFALLRDFETPRYDHRRHRVAVYQYRPSQTLLSDNSTTQRIATLPPSGKAGVETATTMP